METTRIQERIEMLVTNGLGYDSQTKFIEGRRERSSFSENVCAWLFVCEDDVKNSNAGLSAHLAELESKTHLPILKFFHSYLSNNKKSAMQKMRVGHLKYLLYLWCTKSSIGYYERLPNNLKSIAVFSAVHFGSIFNPKGRILEGLIEKLTYSPSMHRY